VRAPAVVMNRGLPQGAPESPLLFVLVMEYVLRPLVRKWSQRGSGWTLDSFHLSAICFADDTLLVSSSKADLETMLEELVAALAVVGLDVGVPKCHWTSYPSLPRDTLRLQGADLLWEAQIKFVGAIFDFSGNDEAALEYRLAQAEKAFHKWASIMQCSSASLHRRLHVLQANVFSAALWLSETWLLTKQ
jgi:hypothetical protein